MEARSGCTEQIVPTDENLPTNHNVDLVHFKNKNKRPYTKWVKLKQNKHIAKSITPGSHYRKCSDSEKGNQQGLFVGQSLIKFGV